MLSLFSLLIPFLSIKSKSYKLFIYEHIKFFECEKKKRQRGEQIQLFSSTQIFVTVHYPEIHFVIYHTSFYIYSHFVFVKP